MAAGVGGAPHHDPLWVDALKAACECDRRRIVLELQWRGEQLPRLALARSEIAVVERKRVNPGGGEALGVGDEARVDGAPEAVGEHHAGTATVLTGEGIALAA